MKQKGQVEEEISLPSVTQEQTIGNEREHPDADADSPLSRMLCFGDRRGSLVGAILDWVSRAIIEGRLQPGDDLNSVDLAHRFNTSRAPVREALILLEKEGLVEMQARRRPRVATISLRQVRELYQVRATLHALVAELIVTNASDEEIVTLQESYQRMVAAERAGDLNAFFWANVALHERATEICGNATVKQLLDSLGLRTLQMRHLSLSQPQRMTQSLADHERLLRAYAERDPLLASALMRANILGALRAIEHSGWTGIHALPSSEPA